MQRITEPVRPAGHRHVWRLYAPARLEYLPGPVDWCDCGAWRPHVDDEELLTTGQAIAMIAGGAAAALAIAWTWIVLVAA